MSQIVKNIPMMAEGGATPAQTQASTPKTYGKFVMNGQEEQVTDDLINQFSNWLSSQPRDVQNSLVDVRKKLQSGQDVNFDAQAQELSGNVELPLKNERQESRMKRKRSGMGMLFDALTNSQVHRNAVAMDALSGFKYNKPTPVPIKPTDIKFSRYEVDYNPTSDGKSRTYSTNPANAAAFDRINQFFDFQEMDEEGRKGANLNFTGFSDLTLDEMLKHTKRTDFEAARNRVMSNTATAEDWDLLNRFNIWNPESDSVASTAPLTPEQQEKQARRVISDYGIDVEQANKYGIRLGDDMNLDFSQLPENRLHIFSKYSPFSKGKYFGGAVYNNRYYSPEEVKTDATIQSILTPYKEQIAKGDYRDTSTVNFHWGETPEYQEYDPKQGYLAEFHDYLLPQNNKNQQFVNLAPRYQTQEGEQYIAIPDFSEGSDVYGHAAKTKYLTYNPQTGIKLNYENVLQPRLAPDVSKQVTMVPWGDRYKNKERYAHVLNSGPYDFYIGEKDQRLYVSQNKGEDYYLVQDFDIYNKIKQGDLGNVSRADIDKMFKGKTGKIIQSEDKWWANDNTTGYRHVGGSGKNSPWVNLYGQIDMNAAWVKGLAELDTARERTLGKGRKYQYGGAFRGIDTTQKKTTRDKQELPLNVADKTQTNVLFSGQGLNANDKLELAAMASDLAGLGLSFIPGAGNIAGGVAGVAGTGMQFAADIGRDGLDWGDVGRGAANLGLDALTFIPGLGTAAKAGKVVRNIRRIGNTVLKTLALTGAGAGAATAAQKIISGDKWTMDDLRIVVAGLQGGVAAGRSIGAQAKAGKQLKTIKNKEIAVKNQGITEGGLTKTATLKGLEESTITKGKGKKKTTTTTTNEVSKDLELKLTDKDIKEFNTLKGETAKNEFIANKLKTTHNFTPTSEQTKSLTEAFNIPKDKTIGFKGKSVTTKKGKLEGETKTKPLTTRQAYKQVSRGFSFRNKDIKNTAIEATQPFINRSALTKAGRNPLAGPRSLWEVGQSPWRSLQVTRGGESSDKALKRDKELQNQYQTYKEGGKITKFQPGGLFNILGNVINSYDSQGNRIYYRPGGGSNQAIAWFPKGQGTTRIGGGLTPEQMARLQSGQGILDLPWAQQTSVTNVPVTTSTAARSARRPVAQTARPITQNTRITPISTTGTITTTMPEMRKTELAGITTPASTSASTTAVTTGQTAVVPKESGGWQGMFANLGKFGLNQDNLLAAGSLVMALGKTNRQSKIIKKALQTAMGALESTPLEIYPRFTDYGVNSAYENAAQQQLGIKPATSDYLMSHAIEQDAKNKAEQLRLEGRLKTSELFSNYLNQTNDLRRNYAGIRTDVANRNRQRLAQLNMGIAENETARLANNYQSLNNFIMEKRDRLAQDQARSGQYDEMILQSNLQNYAQDQLSKFVSSKQSQYNALIASNPKAQQQYPTLDSYVRNTYPTEYAQEMNKLNVDLIKQAQVGNRKYGNLGQLFSPFKYERPVTTMAKGGKTKTKSLNAAEQIWINQNKDVADAVKQLNKNVLTLFLKATT